MSKITHILRLSLSLLINEGMFCKQKGKAHTITGIKQEL